MHLKQHSAHSTCIICLEPECDDEHGQDHNSNPRVKCECHASTCRDCLARYITFELEQRGAGTGRLSINCPSPYCSTEFTHAQLLDLVGQSALNNSTGIPATAHNTQVTLRTVMRQERYQRERQQALARIETEAVVNRGLLPKCRDCDHRLQLLPIAISRHWIVLCCGNELCKPTAGSSWRCAVISALKALHVSKMVYETHYCIFCNEPQFMSGAFGNFFPACTCYMSHAAKSSLRRTTIDDGAGASGPSDDVDVAGVIEDTSAGATAHEVSEDVVSTPEMSSLAQWYLKQDPAQVRCCPTCLTFVEKNEGCNRVSCACGAVFCWACLVPMENHSSSTCHYRSMSIDFSRVRNYRQAFVKYVLSELPAIVVFFAMLWMQPLSVIVLASILGSAIGSLKMRSAILRKKRNSWRLALRQRRIDAQREMVTRGVDLYVICSSEARRSIFIDNLLSDIGAEGNRGRVANAAETEQGIRAVLFPTLRNLDSTAVVVRVRDVAASIHVPESACVVEHCLDGDSVEGTFVVVEEDRGEVTETEMQALEKCIRLHVLSHLHGQRVDLD